MNNQTFFDGWDFKRGEYTSKVAYRWSGGTLPWGKAEEAWDPVVLYRKLLSEAEDGSVTIASIGFLDNVCPRNVAIPTGSCLLTPTVVWTSQLQSRQVLQA
jgi:hypothetical protein